MEREGVLRAMERHEKKKMVWGIVIACVLAALIILTVLYLFFYKTIGCTSIECFESSMKDCKRAVYINDGTQAVWQYTIKGTSGDLCQINVNLLSAKQGEVLMEKLQGFDMDCFYPKGMFAYPEKDLKYCHGRLKEEFQTVTIDRLHTTIVQNLESIAKQLGPIGGF